MASYPVVIPVHPDDGKENPGMLADTTVSLPMSAFPPLALGFFGLGTGYLIYGPQELFKFPSRDGAVDLATGIWGVWMPGFLQFLTGTYLFVGLAWFHSFSAPPLYMAALAFTAYGVHWFAIGYNRAHGASPLPNGFMAIAFTAISVLGLIVFFDVGDAGVGGLFVGLTLIYLSDIVASLKLGPAGMAERLLGFFHIGTGLWLMYLMFGVTLNFAAHFTLPV
ncbi:MAG TPA: hypothetical protein VI434_13685 [Candidatus Dormibacteraeota bacterium]